MINVLHISDIHFGWNKLEEDGVVLDAFFDDIENTMPKENKDDNYCFISGDLVYKGCNDYEYELFYRDFISKITQTIPLDNIIVLAGNHDLNRNWVENNIEEHKEDIYKDRSEVEYNDYLNEEGCQLLKKFTPFNKFCKEVMHIPEFNITGYYRNITSDVSVFMLNSALNASGGADDIKDEGNLAIETSKLNEWLTKNKGRTKVLVMHHPISHLKEFYQNEIVSMCRNGIDYIFAGHLHDQNVYQVGNAKVFISPQLYSKKADLNGYSIIRFEKGILKEIEYKEWNKRFRKFMNGQSFTGTNDGKWINIVKAEDEVIDVVENKLQEDFDIAMTSYNLRPQWVERKLSIQSLNQRHEEKTIDLDYLDIMNDVASYQIIAPAQFGLTCFARYLALNAWCKFRQKWIYVDARDWTLSKVEPDLEKAHNHLGTTITESDCILLDNWKINYREKDKIYSKLKRLLSQKRIIFLTHGTDPISTDLYDEEHETLKCLYLKEIGRRDLRTIVNSIDINHEIAEENVVVERLNQDIIALNMHRIPYNSMQFVKSYAKSFEKRAVNRTRVIEGVLRAIFDNPGNLTYGSEIDDGNCKFIMGYFCQILIESNKLFFSYDEFISVCKPFVESQYNPTNLHDLIQILINNQVLEPVGDSLQFRHVFWVSYFVALRMKDDSDFAKKMLEDNNGLYNADLIDFYTGIDGRSTDAVTCLTEKLYDLSDSVCHHVGLDGDFNPFKNIKWRLTETQTGITQENLEERIKQSRMPDEIKEAVADRDFDSVKPYSQQIYTFLDEFDVRNLMQALVSASRALRNSEFIKPEDKEKLSNSIFKGWEVLMRVLFYIAPLMAKNGYGGYGGASFKLSDDFPKEKERDPSKEKERYAECLKQIIISMPYNIILWYKNDVFSDKLTLIFTKYLLEHKNEIVRHLLALLICNCRPKDFQQILSSYIGTIGKNTYYLGDLYSSLRNNYSYDFMSPKELIQTASLIKSCYMKHVKGVLEPGRDTIAKFGQYQGQLPKRFVEDE